MYGTQQKLDPEEVWVGPDVEPTFPSRPRPARQAPRPVAAPTDAQCASARPRAHGVEHLVLCEDAADIVGEPTNSIISTVCVLHHDSHLSLSRPPSPAPELPMVVCDAEEGLGEGSAAPPPRFTSAVRRARTASAVCAGMVLGDATTFSLHPTPDCSMNQRCTYSHTSPARTSTNTHISTRTSSFPAQLDSHLFPPSPFHQTGPQQTTPKGIAHELGRVSSTRSASPPHLSTAHLSTSSLSLNRPTLMGSPRPPPRPGPATAQTRRRVRDGCAGHAPVRGRTDEDVDLTIVLSVPASI
ncbi:hypothetical protein B0H14DRAFT_3473834 [Mycena olivaceomarginata]|nr:hypothetical protein B0H14DRAFT_3473834 [Mycena olivaceomarginata]